MSSIQWGLDVTIGQFAPHREPLLDKIGGPSD